MKILRACAVVALLAGSSGCFLFHDDYPDKSCESDNDCFVSMGERCVDKVCEVTVTFDARPASADEGSDEE